MHITTYALVAIMWSVMCFHSLAAAGEQNAAYARGTRVDTDWDRFQQDVEHRSALLAQVAIVVQMSRGCQGGIRGTVESGTELRVSMEWHTGDMFGAIRGEQFYTKK